MKILVTGSSGNVGRVLKESLEKKFDVVYLTRNKTNKGIYGDLRDYDSLMKATERIDLIIHLAGAIKGNKKHLEGVNIKGTKNLINACEKNNVKKIIFVSTLDVKFETDYGFSKLNAEKIIEASKLEYIILRPGLIYGKNFNTGINSLIEILKKSQIIIIIWNGNNLYRHLYVGDLVKLIKKIINKKKFNNRIYFVCGKDIISMNDLIDLICLKLNKKRIKIHLPIFMFKILKLFPFLRIDWKNFVVNKKESSNKIKKDFNFNPIGIKEGINKILRPNRA